MSDKPQVGDKVRATIVREGVVMSVSEHGLVLEDGYAMNLALNNGLGRTVQIIEKAKPKWQDGDIAISSLEQVRVRMNGDWYSFDGVRQTIGDNAGAVTYQYRLVMRDGKFV